MSSARRWPPSCRRGEFKPPGSLVCEVTACVSDVQSKSSTTFCMEKLQRSDLCTGGNSKACRLFLDDESNKVFAIQIIRSSALLCKQETNVNDR